MRGPLVGKPSLCSLMIAPDIVDEEEEAVSGGKRQDQKPEKELLFEKLRSDIGTRVRHGAP